MSQVRTDLLEAHRSERVRTLRPSRLACLMVLVAALLGCVLPQAAAAEGFALSKTETPSPICSEPEPNGATCEALRVPTVPASSTQAFGPEFEGSGEKGGFSPKDLREAYKLPETGGSSTTIAIVDAYNDPNAESDLQKYREKYKVYYKTGETACTETNKCFKKVNEKGETKNYPSNSEGWSGEISLDLDMVSAACAECKILLVEASSETIGDLGASNEEAETLGASAVSNSWNIGFEGAEAGEIGSTEESTDNKYFNHEKIPLLFAGGDYGYSARYPAISQYVVAVGGTRLKKESESSRKWTEEVWSNSAYGYRQKGRGTGSGCSKYQSKPKWQTDKACTKRIETDVSAMAAPESPVSVYDTYDGGWTNFGGTSASSPFVAGIEGLSTAHSRKVGAEAFYVAGEKGSLFDVTKGNNGTCTPPAEDEYFCTAKVSYDGPTGWGAPNGALALVSGPPENTALPAVSPATPEQGVAESATTGTWTNEPTSSTYQWERCNATGGECKEISDSTSSTYTPVEADVDHTLVVKVTAKNEGGSNSALSAATALVLRITEYALPSNSLPVGMTVGPDSNLWFTDYSTSKVGKITTSGTITEYSLPESSWPRGQDASGPDGNVWFTDHGSSKIGKITTSGTITEYALPSLSNPSGIAAGPDGNLWFTDYGTSKVGKITTSGTITEYPLP